MKTYLLNPTIKRQPKFIREGRCMQKASSWATAWPPITLAALGAIARNSGPVRLLDGNVEQLSMKELLSDIASFGADLVVISTGFASIDDDMRVAHAIKQFLPDVTLAGIGLFFTLTEEKAFETYPCLDVAICCEPEGVFAELLERREKGTKDFSNIPGLMYRKGGAVRVSKPREFIRDLDALPYPDRSLLDNDRYRLPHNNERYTLINTARGCPYNCSFCVVKACYGSRVRRHSLSYVLQEIEECIFTYGIREFLFWEEGFTLDREYVLAFCDEVKKRGLSISWTTTTRVDAVDREVLAAMKSAGCYLLGLGVETTSQEILDNIKKGQTVEDIYRAVRLCNEVGIDTMGHLIFGLPGENRQTAEKTIQDALTIGLKYIQCYCAVPYPKTDVGDRALREGRICSTHWADYNVGGKSIMRNESLSCDEITALRNKAFRRFYLRPGYLLKTALGLVSLKRLMGVATFCGWMTITRTISRR